MDKISSRERGFDLSSKTGYISGLVYLKKGSAIFFSIFLIFSIFIHTNIAQSNEGIQMTLLKPLERTSIEIQETTTNEVYEVRKGRVSLNTKAFYQGDQIQDSKFSSTALLKGKTVEIGFFQDKRFDVIVESENRLENNTILFSGKIINAELSTMTITVTPETYIINIQDMDNSMLYRVVGNTSTGIGVVVEIDQKKLPPMMGLPPLVTPTNE